MPRPTLYIAITSHGFGHATRTAAIAATLRQHLPEVDLVLATTAPQWLLDEYLPDQPPYPPYEYRPVATDLGVVQQDSLTMDLPLTLEKLQDLQRREQDIVAAEAAYLRQRGVGLVLADIPPLATAIAHAAGVPCWMASNFAWDFIYRSFGSEFGPVADWMTGWFGQCDRLFRLPFHEPMAAFPTVEDAGLTGGTPRHSIAELTALLAPAAPPERTALLSFGGLGIQGLSYEGLAQFPDWQFFSFDQGVPHLPNLRPLPRHGLRPVDVMPLCGRVVTKPGYSTFSEACRLGVPIFTVTRDDFAEGPVLTAGVQDHSWHRILSPEDLRQGDWDFLRQPLVPPRSPAPLATDGNERIAAAIADYLS